MSDRAHAVTRRAIEQGLERADAIDRRRKVLAEIEALANHDERFLWPDGDSPSSLANEAHAVLSVPQLPTRRREVRLWAAACLVRALAMTKEGPAS